MSMRSIDLPVIRLEALSFQVIKLERLEYNNLNDVILFAISAGFLP